VIDIDARPEPMGEGAARFDDRDIV